MADTERLLSLKAPSGISLEPFRLSASESLGLPFEVRIQAVSEDHGLKASDLLTKPVTATVRMRNGSERVLRHFHGHVASFERLGPASGGTSLYGLLLVPGIWRLSLRCNSRIFQGKSAKDIVNGILAEHELPSPKWGMATSLAAMPYCTQFNETDLHFVSRLLEEHGLTYYFTHLENEHQMHISGTNRGFPAFVGPAKTLLFGQSGLDHLSALTRTNRVRPAVVELVDMDDERNKPSAVIRKKTQTRAYAGEPSMWGSAQLSKWPGGMSTRPETDPSLLSMGALESASEVFEARGMEPRFTPGQRVTVKMMSEDGASQEEQFVLTSVLHEANDSTSVNAGAGGRESYDCSSEMVSVQREFMPQQRHPKPVMAGLHSAKVTGPAGQKIHVDEFGRVKVKFRWDVRAKDDDSSSCWVRVAQAAAGAWGGTWFLPRVGDEVLVAFLDGDADRPVVTGSLYNSESVPPFRPKGNRTQMGIATQSDPGGSSAKANVLRFEDKSGKEEVLLHAQKDLAIEVEDARKATIEKGDDTLVLEKGNRSTDINSGNDSLTLKQGNVTIKCSAGSITMEAMQKITLKVGSNTLVIDQTGITAKGMMITHEAQAMHKTKAPMVQTNGSGLVQLQGGLITLN